MVNNSDKIKLGIIGAILVIMIFGTAGCTPSNTSNVANISNNLDDSIVVQKENQVAIEQPQSNIQKNTTVTEGSGTYTGDIIDGMRHDENGKFEFTNGYIYEGSFIHNQIEGKGKLIVPNIGVYEGEFFNGVRSGTGKMTYNNGDIYVGHWENDQMSGNGKYIFSNGDVYEGEFAKNMFNGTGTYTLKSTGEKYSGSWSNNNYKG